MEVEPAALQATPQPPDALLNLRSQCENQSKQQQLYAKKPANWLDWEKAQEARVKCAAAWAKAGSLSHDKKIALLKEYLVLLFHTVMPPDVSPSRGPYAQHSCCRLLSCKLDVHAPLVCLALGQRVGIVRKLRWNATLKRDAPGAYRLDMTEARFKNSRFYVRWPEHPVQSSSHTPIAYMHAYRFRTGTFCNVDQLAHCPRARSIHRAHRVRL